MMMAFYRAATKSHPLRRSVEDDDELEKTPDAEGDIVLMTAGRARPRDFVKVARLRLFGELLQSGPPVVFALVARLLLMAAAPQRNSWPKMLIEDLRWVRQYTDMFKDMGDPGEDLLPWEAVFKASHQSWKYRLGEVLQAAADDAPRA